MSEKNTRRERHIVLCPRCKRDMIDRDHRKVEVDIIREGDIEYVINDRPCPPCRGQYGVLLDARPIKAIIVNYPMPATRIAVGFRGVTSISMSAGALWFEVYYYDEDLPREAWCHVSAVFREKEEKNG